MKYLICIFLFILSFNLNSQICQYNTVILELNTGSWAAEISWSITDSTGNLIDTSNQIYLDHTQYIDTLCLPNGCYNFNMYDSYGDGWQGGSYQLLYSIGVIASGSLQGQYYFGSDQFSINGGLQCPLLGCTDPNSHNYNPLATIDDSSCQIISDNVELLYNWQGDSLPVSSIGGQYTEVYGFVHDTREYAVIGTTLGTHIIDVTDPFSSQEVSYIAGANQGNIIHRDYHVMDNYLYAVCDQGPSTLQIIDFSYLPDSTSVVYDSWQLFSTMHNIFIDTLHRKLYTTNGPVYDLTDPVNPTLLFDMGFYCHDMYIEDNIGYFNRGSAGMYIYDLTNNTPQNIGFIDIYPYQGYNHSGWLSENDSIYVFADETHGSHLKVTDVSNYNNITVLSTLTSGTAPNAVAHNLIIKDNYLYISYYHDGLQIFDISDPYNPIKVGYYDTYSPNNHNGWAGAWGVYPLLSSGIILVSDIQSGLFVLKFNPDQLSICEGDSVLLDSVYQQLPGTYTHLFVDSLGYEDIIVTNLSILPNNFYNDTLSVFNGDSIQIANNYCSIQGDYIDTLSNQYGCDSILYTHLMVNPVIIQNIDICDGETFFAQGDYQANPGVFYDTLFALSVDSLIITNLMVYNNYFTDTTIVINEGDSVLVGLNYLSEQGAYLDTLTTINGCDSILFTTLIVQIVNNIQNDFSNIIFYPNPAQEYLNICSNDKSFYNDIRIYNNLGVEFIFNTKILDNCIVIELNNIIKGIYYVCLTNKNRSKVFYKLVVN